MKSGSMVGFVSVGNQFVRLGSCDGSGSLGSIAHTRSVFVRRPMRSYNGSIVRMENKEPESSSKMDFGDTPAPVAKEVDEEALKKQQEIIALRKKEKFIEIDEGQFECQNCSYVYDPKKGDQYAGVKPGLPFDMLPETFSCPGCKSDKSEFKSIKKVIAGFADNQSYGFGTNTWTEAQKSGLIFGGLAAFFLLFLSGYLLE
uniref:Rubredoxin-like domain-containing protein n=1 Tax=Timspurckia oligopyrenoides TaxID=708627 RepID=A0A7S0ZKG2_9RHOD|mmetsp:Transcript_8775/g.15825  ORF Transcript_8775/g.15825 Transcript_8775/m.15825 type:complete len:201 (+) Transcript_8775:56-658(+)|eukprot:CAMPEP_0182441512 /NCGR_PEP_ID=MMETSP1172-20130603/492_1 /TAXON_ID=708627 /ORGANISM="Timspurckia oligopyrenoides, Strain CCMP3278" /LENGTH=200 /DNA_ID=CAMNT_0024635853 /DNA_START=46 /DNA_END=648 /DNA_ORIENTATION=-